MNPKATLRDLAKGEVVGEGHSGLEEWYRKVELVPLRELADGDLARACRQNLFLESIIPIALERIRASPAAGDLYDGEIARSISTIAFTFWSHHPEIAKEVVATLQEAIGSLDDDVRLDVQVFLDRCGQVFTRQNDHDPIR
jgi:hypothetical protein